MGPSDVTREAVESINMKPRNPVWVRDELILALDFYLRFRDRFPDKASAEIADLSADINALGRRLGLAGGDPAGRVNERRLERRG